MVARILASRTPTRASQTLLTMTEVVGVAGEEELVKLSTPESRMITRQPSLCQVNLASLLQTEVVDVEVEVVRVSHLTLDIKVSKK